MLSQINVHNSIESPLNLCSTITRHEPLADHAYSVLWDTLFIGHQPSKLKFLLDVDGVTLTVLLRWVASLSVSACHEEYPVTSHTSYQNKDLTQIVSLYIGFKSVSGNQTHSKYLFLYWLICTSWIYKFLSSKNLTNISPESLNPKS